MTDPLSRDEIRKRHQSWEITDTGSPLDVCDRCQADWPCDAIRLADEVEQRRKDSERLAAKVVTDAEEITRLRAALEFYASEENLTARSPAPRWRTPMKKRETINLLLHITVGGVLTGLVLWQSYFVLLMVFIFAWLREQAQHRKILIEEGTVTGFELGTVRTYRVEKETFFGWMTGHRIFEVFQWVIGCFVALVLYELLIWFKLVGN